MNLITSWKKQFNAISFPSALIAIIRTKATLTEWLHLWPHRHVHSVCRNNHSSNNSNNSNNFSCCAPKNVRYIPESSFVDSKTCRAVVHNVRSIVKKIPWITTALSLNTVNADIYFCVCSVRSTKKKFLSSKFKKRTFKCGKMYLLFFCFKIE